MDEHSEVSGYDSSRRTRTVWRRTERLDPETGEYIINEEAEELRYGQAKFCMVQLDVFLEVMMGLSGNARLVLSYVMRKASRSGNLALIKQKSAAEDLGLSKATVERCFIELRRADVIRMRESCQWMLNPSVANSCGSDRVEWLKSLYNSLPSWEQRKSLRETEEEEIYVIRENDGDAASDSGGEGSCLYS